MTQMMSLFPAGGGDDSGVSGTMVVAFRVDRGLEQILPALRSLVGVQQTPK